MVLDAKDRALISALVQNARVTDAQLSRRLRLDRQTISRRVKRLVHERTIRSFETRLDYSSLGFLHYEAWMAVSNFVGERKQAMISFFCEHPFSNWVGECLGSYNLRVTFIARDDQHMQSIASEIHTKFGRFIEDFNLLTVAENTKQSLYDAGATAPTGRHDLDMIDVDILELLSKDPRRRLTDIAGHVGMTLEGVRQRVHRLEEFGVIRGFSANIDPKALDTFWAILLVNFTTMDASFKRKLLRYTLEKDYAGNSYLLLGSWQYHMTINGVSLQHLSESIQDFEAHFSSYVKRYLPVIVTASHKYPKLPLGIFHALRARLPS